jgi:hypothetical protein
LLRIKDNQYSIFQQKILFIVIKAIYMIFGSLLGTIVGSLFGFKAQEIVQN